VGGNPRDSLSRRGPSRFVALANFRGYSPLIRRLIITETPGADVLIPRPERDRSPLVLPLLVAVALPRSIPLRSRR
jgi:hypothetical protein